MALSLLPKENIGYVLALGCKGNHWNMVSITRRLATKRNRWIALLFIALGFGIVVIDNTVLNVSIPYMLRDLSAQLSQIEWAISGYALTIATLLITFGRLSDLVGRKKMFLIGMVVFAIGSFLASTATSPLFFIISRAIIQAVGAAIVLTAGLALLASTFEGRERAIAFGVWGAVAGASASVGPLLGGYLTTYYSWRWSLRINVAIAIIAFIGSVFIMESRGEREQRFDILGTLLSGAGIFLFVFGFTEGQTYGWITPTQTFSFFGLTWPLKTISIVPFSFAAGILLLALFVIVELRLEKSGREPFLPMSLFKNSAFSLSSLSLLLMVLGLFGTFFSMPIYFEIVLGLNAFQVGVELLYVSISVFIFGILSGFIVARVRIKWVIIVGNLLLVIGTFLLPLILRINSTGLTLAPALIPIGIGFGLSSSQLNNLIISSAPPQLAGTASGESNVMRQIGISIGVTVIGAILASTLASNIAAAILSDKAIPPQDKAPIIAALTRINVVSGQVTAGLNPNLSSKLTGPIKRDIDNALVASMKSAMQVGFYTALAAMVCSLFLPVVPSTIRAIATGMGSAAPPGSRKRAG